MKWLGTFRGLAILAVVLSHAPYYGLTALSDGGWWGYRAGQSPPTPDWHWVGNLNYYALIGMNQLGLFSVPLFLFASGFFAAYAARSSRGSLPWTVVRGWLKGVVTSYVAWLILSVLLYGLLVLVTHRPPELGNAIERRLLDYYYIPLLVQLMILSPGLAWLASRRPLLLLGLSGGVEGAVAVLHYVTYLGVPDVGALALLNQWNWLIFWQDIFFFSLGLVLFSSYASVRTYLARVRWPLIGATAAFGILSIVETATLHRFDHDYMNNLEWKGTTALYALAAILALVSWDWNRGRLVNALDRLGTASLGIYLMQAIVLDYATKVVYIIRPQLLVNQVFLQPVLIIAGIALPLMSMWIVARSPLRRYHYYLFGSHASGMQRARPQPGIIRTMPEKAAS